MYKKFHHLLLVLLFVLPVTAVNAESSPLYIGINVASFDSKYHTYEPEGGSISLGWDLNNFFTFEVSGGASDTYTDDTNNDEFSVDYTASAFLRFNLRFNRVTLYAMGGYSKAKTTATIAGTTTSEETEGGSFGYGIDFYGTPDLALSVRRVEYFDLDNEADGKVHLGATMLGITYYYDTPRIRSRY